MRQQYNPENLDAWVKYYGDQASQTGYGLVGFRGTLYQRGAGLGSFFRSLFRMTVPVMKSAASHVGKQALSTGVNLATDLVHGRRFVEALEDHAKQGTSELLSKANRALQKGRGLGYRPKRIKGAENDIFDKKVKKAKKMSLVDEFSSPSTKSELDFFTVPPTQVVTKKGFRDEINPTNPVTNDGPYEFCIPADAHFIQLSKNYVYMLLRITQTPPTPGQQAALLVGPINLIGKTFFKQVNLYLGGKLVFDSGDKYAYRSFIETELNYGTDAKRSHLQSALYTSEAGDKFDDADNEGFKERAGYFKDGKTVEVTALLHIDLFMQDR